MIARVANRGLWFWLPLVSIVIVGCSNTDASDQDGGGAKADTT